jgi:hypothetical protein
MLLPPPSVLLKTTTINAMTIDTKTGLHGSKTIRAHSQEPIVRVTPLLSSFSTKTTLLPPQHWLRIPTLFSLKLKVMPETAELFR